MTTFHVPILKVKNYVSVEKKGKRQPSKCLIGTDVDKQTLNKDSSRSDGDSDVERKSAGVRMQYEAAASQRRAEKASLYVAKGNTVKGNFRFKLRNISSELS